MGAPMYTECVERDKYEDLDLTPEAVVAAGSFLLFGVVGLFGSLVAAMSALRKILEYMLYGKLVCLGGDRCAVGRIAAFETVDDKSGFDRIDNDFSMNLLLAPYDLEFFTQGSFEDRYKLVIKEPKQGALITEQANMPEPREPKDGKHFEPYYVEFPDKTYITYNPFLGSHGVPYKVPVFHCEIEGERLITIYKALNLPFSLIPGLDKVCRIKVFGIPVGRWACAVVAALLAPAILAALAIAWAAGSDDNRDFDNAGSLSRGDAVIIRGRWVYDAGHSGWNEFHPVISVQKLSEQEVKANVASGHSWTHFDDLYDRWCHQTGIAPLPADVGTRPAGMTPEQGAVYDAQQQPENQWDLHPLVDGCRPRHEDDPKPPPGPIIH